MTLVAAMLFTDRILIASDSKVTMEGYVGSTPKLHTVPTLSIVWAGAGEEEVIDDFGRWVENYDWQSDQGWAGVREDVRKALNKLNRAKRTAMRESGSRAKSRDLASVLIAGYLDEEANILEVTDKGESYLHAQRGYGVIGSGEPHFRIAKSVLDIFAATYLNKDELDYRENGHFWFAVKVATTTDPNSGKGLQRCQITSTSVACDEKISDQGST